MKLPRTSLGSIGFAILVLAIDFAVVRGVFAGESARWSVFALVMLPMVDLLLIRLYRLRKPARRTAGAVGFFVAGLVATVGMFSVSVVCADEVLGLLRSIARPMIMPLQDALTRQFGNAVMQSTPMGLAFGITFELLFPVAFFCLPLLLIASLGGALARRFGGQGSNPEPQATQPEITPVDLGPVVLGKSAC